MAPFKRSASVLRGASARKYPAQGWTAACAAMAWTTCAICCPKRPSQEDQDSSQRQSLSQGAGQGLSAAHPEDPHRQRQGVHRLVVLQQEGRNGEHGFDQLRQARAYSTGSHQCAHRRPMAWSSGSTAGSARCSRAISFMTAKTWLLHWGAMRTCTTSSSRCSRSQRWGNHAHAGDEGLAQKEA